MRPTRSASVIVARGGTRPRHSSDRYRLFGEDWIFPWHSFPVRNGEDCAPPGKPTGWKMVGVGGDQSKDAEVLVFMPDGDGLVGNPEHHDRPLDDAELAVEDRLGGRGDGSADVFVVVHGAAEHYSLSR
jgi:hypothetical protein